ncbi:MAG: hypothetical protein R3231_10650, partial [bacterium]|nr:hypothetical protein [bacterium]
TETCNEGTDTCDPIITGCASDAECDNGNACDGAETCNTLTGDCTAGIPLACNDGDPCNGIESCDPMTGFCVAGTAVVCDDGNPCNGMESCNPADGNCLAGQDLCAADQQCDPQTGACTAGGTNHLQTTCLGCHGDLSGGTTCATGTNHVARVGQAVWDEALIELGLNCDTAPPDSGTPPASGLPADHTDREDGAMHKPGKNRPYSNSCTTCHGSDLRGDMGPSCYTCHGREWDEREPSDGDTGAPADHTDREDGAMHKPGKNRPYSNSCTMCHGTDLTGGLGPSCYTCHGREWDERGPGMDRPYDDDDDSSDDDDRRLYRRR